MRDTPAHARGILSHGSTAEHRQCGAARPGMVRRGGFVQFAVLPAYQQPYGRGSSVPPVMAPDDAYRFLPEPARTGRDR